MSKGVGLSKYPKSLSKSEINNEGMFFICPRAISSSEYNLSSFDVSVFIALLSYTGIVYENKVRTPMLSLELISELVLRSKSKKNKEKVINSIDKLNESGLLVSSKINENMFMAKIDVSKGYFKYYHEDLYKILSTDTVSSLHKSLHVSVFEFSMLFGDRSGHDSHEKFITYRSHSSLGELCGMSRQTISRVLQGLEDDKIIASYNVKMSNNGAPLKSLRARYMHRDILRNYVEDGLGVRYARVIKERENKEILPNGQE